MAGFSREVARRIFAEELRSSNLAFRESDDQNQYAPQYLLTPTGARCNRVFLVGTLTERDDIGGETEYWRGRVVDPTGSLPVYAGQYQPEAAQVLAGLEPPAFVAVVGKPSLYETEDGKVIISLRAEAVQRVDAVTRDRWVVETARLTLERIKAMKALGAGPSKDGFVTAQEDYSSGPASDYDLERARHHYQADLNQYKNMVLRALEALDQEKVWEEEKGTAKATTSETKKDVKKSGEMKPLNIKEISPSQGEGFKARESPRKILKPSRLGDLNSGDLDEVEELDFGKRG
jgi:RPA family protein